MLPDGFVIDGDGMRTGYAAGGEPLIAIDHERLTYRHGGRDHRLTDVHGRILKDILS